MRLEIELGLEFRHVADFGQRGQVVQAGQAEVVQKAPGGAEQGRLAGYVAVPHHPDPFAFLQRADDAGAHRDTPHFLDVAAGDRLAVGDQRQGFQQRAGIALRTLFPQPRYPGVDLLAHLDAKTAGDLFQFDTALGVILAQFRQGGADVGVGLTDYASIKARFPAAKKTVTRFRDGGYCGCNLFAFMTPEARRVADFWRRLEQDRKRPWRLIRALGWVSLLRWQLGRLSLAQALELLSERLGLRLGHVLLPFADAAVDVDTAADWAYVRRRLERPRAGE